MAKNTIHTIFARAKNALFRVQKRLNQSAENVLIVPVTAVKGDSDGKYVEVLNPQGVVVKVMVETGVSDGLNIEVKGALNENDEVVIAQMSSAEISDKAMSARGPRRGF